MTTTTTTRQRRPHSCGDERCSEREQQGQRCPWCWGGCWGNCPDGTCDQQGCPGNTGRGR